MVNDWVKFGPDFTFILMEVKVLLLELIKINYYVVFAFESIHILNYIPQFIDKIDRMIKNSIPNPKIMIIVI